MMIFISKNIKKKMNKTIATLLLILIPIRVFAVELPAIAPLNKGEAAPYSGVLYNPAAIAETIAQRELLVSEHKLTLKILEERLQAECDLSIDNLAAEVDACNDKYNYMTGIKDEQIRRLEILAFDKSDNHSHWWFVGGIVSGALITIGVVYALK